MAFPLLSAEAKSLAHAIHKFLRKTGNKKASHIKSTLQKLVNCIAATEAINSPLLNILKRKTKAAESAFSRFYNSSWLTDTDKFCTIVTRFEELIANSQIMDSFFQQSITSTILFDVTTAIATI